MHSRQKPLAVRPLGEKASISAPADRSAASRFWSSEQDSKDVIMGFSATASRAVLALTMSLIAFGLGLKLNFTVLFIVAAESV